jgi:glycerol-3-phosphate O-acyltransferase
MKLKINDNSLLKQLQEEFNEVYPYLWIDFYFNSFSKGLNVMPDKINANTQIKDLCKLNGESTINIESNLSISQLETEFLEKLGLKIKVLRRTGNVWLETIFTANWTLECQNAEGQKIIIN